MFCCRSIIHIQNYLFIRSMSNFSIFVTRMDTFMQKTYTIKPILYLIVINQIAGGVFGLSIVFKQSLKFIISYPLIYLFIVGLFSFSLLCGVKICLNRISGLKWAIISQYFQVMQFNILGFGFWVLLCSRNLFSCWIFRHPKLSFVV